ncbi:hypothetical protein Tco_0649266, partial [Tanacetum coccineum]
RHNLSQVVLRVPRVEYFVLEAYSNSDYAGSHGDRNPQLVDVNFWEEG